MPRESLASAQAEDRQRGLSEAQLTQLKGHFTQCAAARAPAARADSSPARGAPAARAPRRAASRVARPRRARGAQAPPAPPPPRHSPPPPRAATPAPRAADIFDLANSTNLRQRVAATAAVYFRRVCATSSFARHDPRVLAPGCLYLASKSEESVVSAKVLLSAMRRLRPGWQVDLKQLLDAEMVRAAAAAAAAAAAQPRRTATAGRPVGARARGKRPDAPPPLPPPPPLPSPPQLILEELDARLLVFSPYLALAKLLASDAQLGDLGQNAWAALNDAHRTDLPLAHAPHVLALGAVYLASVVCSRDIRAWLQGVDADLNEARARAGARGGRAHGAGAGTPGARRPHPPALRGAHAAPPAHAPPPPAPP